MKTTRILIAVSFAALLSACGSQAGSNYVKDTTLSPISRWAFSLAAPLHTPQWKAPSDSLEKIEDYWQKVVQHDLRTAWRFIERPELIQDSTVIQLTGEYVPSDSLPDLFVKHMARLDTAKNEEDNYMIDERRIYSTDPAACRNVPITQHASDTHRAELTALRTALSLHRQVQEMRASK